MSERLRALARMVPAGSRVADIGTDRALLPRILLAGERASFCIATERNPGRLARASSVDLDRLELRAGDGLSVLDPADRIDVLVVAGLGGESIRRILSQRDVRGLGVRRLVLQPETHASAVRRWLDDHGFGIVEERLVESSGRFFPIVAAEADAPPAPWPDALSKEDALEAGPCLVSSGDPAVARYWRRELARNQRILDAGPSGRGRAEALRVRELAARILLSLSEPAGRTRRSGCPR